MGALGGVEFQDIEDGCLKTSRTLSRRGFAGLERVSQTLPGCRRPGLW
jgi:hypothetical protein